MKIIINGLNFGSEEIDGQFFPAIKLVIEGVPDVTFTADISFDSSDRCQEFVDCLMDSIESAKGKIQR